MLQWNPYTYNNKQVVITAGNLCYFFMFPAVILEKPLIPCSKMTKVMIRIQLRLFYHFAEDILRCIFVNEKFCILIEISLKFVPEGEIDNNPALV